jgi:cell division protein FtsL
MTSIKHYILKLLGLSPDNYKLQFREYIRRNRWFIFFLIILLSIFAIIMVNNVRAVNTLMRQSRALELQLKDYENENKLLIKKLQDLQAPERINKIAIEKLEMVKPDKAPVTLE